VTSDKTREKQKGLLVTRYSSLKEQLTTDYMQQATGNLQQARING